jgi:hypothetical protein
VSLPAKLLEAAGIAAVLAGLILGIRNNDMWAELYLALGGIVLFLLGRLLQRLLKPPSGSESGGHAP